MCKPDVIVLDVYLPSVNGFAICETLKKSTAFKDIEIVIVSSFVKNNGKELANVTNAKCFFT